MLTPIYDKPFTLPLRAPESIAAAPTLNVLVPFQLNWPMTQFLQSLVRIDFGERVKLTLLLILPPEPQTLPDMAEQRYAILRGLHAQLQQLPIRFSIETAVGPLVETAVASIKQQHTDLLVLADLLPPFTSLNLDQTLRPLLAQLGCQSIRLPLPSRATA